MMKAYTDLEQSKKLETFLPIESADMHYSTWTILDGEFIVSPNQGDTIEDLREDYGNQIIPCWSLAALLDVLPIGIKLTSSNSSGEIEWICYYESDNDSPLTGCYADNKVDACVEMILKLHEQKLL